MRNGSLTGDDGGLAGGPIINNLQQVRSGVGINAGHAPIVQKQHIRPGQLNQPRAKRTVAMANAQFLAVSENSLVERSVPPATRRLCQCTRQPGLTRTGGAGDQHTVTTVNPVP